MKICSHDNFDENKNFSHVKRQKMQLQLVRSQQIWLAKCAREERTEQKERNLSGAFSNFELSLRCRLNVH